MCSDFGDSYRIYRACELVLTQFLIVSSPTDIHPPIVGMRYTIRILRGGPILEVVLGRVGERGGVMNVGGGDLVNVGGGKCQGGECCILEEEKEEGLGMGYYLVLNDRISAV